GAPLGASTARGKEVPIPHLPGSRAQALPLVDAESNGEAAASEVPLVGRTTPLRAFPQNVADKPVPRVGTEPWQISEEWLGQHERQLQAPRRAEAQVVFLGDSITAGWRSAPAYRAAFAKYAPLNLGVAGDHTQNVLWRIQQGALDGISPRVVVVMIGVNNLGGGFTPQATVSGVQAVVSAVQERLPRSRILLLGILPARHSPSEGLRSKIAEANRLLAAAGWSGATEFRDVGAAFLDPEGKIQKTVMRDFLHPTGEGYQLLSDSVEPLISRLLGS
ncbi:MAG TPA: GDSL-type esterase/lipase family protein, partial [Polyangiaceae bacterium]